MRKVFIRFIALCFLLATTAAHAQSGLSESNTDSSDACMEQNTECAQANSTDYRNALSTNNLRTGSPQSQQQNAAASESSSLLSSSRHGHTTRELPPPQPTEFQRFTKEATGQMLQIYGARLFQSEQADFAPSNLMPASANYVIGPEDELRVRIWGAINYSGNLRVDRSGNIYLPQVGMVHVGGLHFSELDAHIRLATSRVYRNFDLSADLGKIRSIQVYLTGQANKPGAYTVSALGTLISALFACGGPSPQGSLRHIELRRNGRVVTDFDLYAFLLHGDKSKDVQLEPEDVLHIPPAGPQTAIFGSIRVPGIYELREGETLGELIESAGGTSALSAHTRVSIDRSEQNQRRATEFALDANGLSVHLADSDIVRLYSALPAYQKTVTLRGYVANAGRYGWHDGMHISDLLPDKDLLMRRDYWRKRNELGLPKPDYEPLPAAPSAMNNRESRIAPALNSGNRAEMNANASEKADTAEARSSIGASSASNATDLTDEITDSSEVNTPLTKRGIRIVAPEIDWHYAVIERIDPQTFKSSLLPFDLGRLLLQHDSSQDLALQSGDVITIFSQDEIHLPLAEQTKYITLEGEIARAGTYSVMPGETLRDVIARAGGLTEKAYLFGSEFDRESTRILQQQRIDEYVRSLQLETSRSTIAFANYASLAGQNGNGAASNQTVQTEFLNQLRKIRATGRVVLNITPQGKTLDDIPALALENKDRFIVPAQPATVNVVGAVYDQSSFLFHAQSSVDKYLKMAGGTNRSADTRRAYIIRADGSVQNRSTTKGHWGDAFLHARLNPGDTIVVPDKNFRPNLGLKSTLEWTQMFTQLAMGAATISLLK